MDAAISSSRFGEMIVVTPNENTQWGGSFYVNSSVTGNWEDFTVKELVNFIDTNYRTIAQAKSRAIVGHSMGGFGAITLAMKHPEVFSVAYGMNSGFLSFTAELDSKNPDFKKFVQAKTIDELLATKNKNIIGMLMVSQAFSPNPLKLPFYADKPYKMQGNKLVPNPVAYYKWLENDVVKMAEKYKGNLLKLRGIKFDCGDEEDIKLIEINTQVYSYDRDPAKPEQVNVSVAQNLRADNGKVTNMSEGKARGRSFHDGRQNLAPDSVNRGANFAEQWRRAYELDPPFVMVTGWNEWTAGKNSRPNLQILFEQSFASPDLIK